MRKAGILMAVGLTAIILSGSISDGGGSFVAVVLIGLAGAAVMAAGALLGFIEQERDDRTQERDDRTYEKNRRRGSADDNGDQKIIPLKNREREGRDYVDKPAEGREAGNTARR